MNQIRLNIKQLFYVLLAITAIACSSDDTEDVLIYQENQLILRKSYNENTNSVSNFNTSGRFISTIVNGNTANEIKFEQFFNDSDQKIRTLSQRSGWIETNDYGYDNSGRIVEIKKTTDDFFSEVVVITNFTYSDAQIIGTSTVNQEDFEYIFMFTDDSYEELISFKATNVSTGQIFFEENYSYHSNGNFKKTTIVNSVLEQLDAVMFTYEYDDKINPLAATNRIDYLSEILTRTDKNAGSLVTILVYFSKNNRKTSFIEDHAITIEYNEEGFITKETDGPTVPDGSSDNVILFEYY